LLSRLFPLASAFDALFVMRPFLAFCTTTLGRAVLEVLPVSACLLTGQKFFVIDFFPGDFSFFCLLFFLSSHNDWIGIVICHLQLWAPRLPSHSFILVFPPFYKSPRRLVFPSFGEDGLFVNHVRGLQRELFFAFFLKVGPHGRGFMSPIFFFSEKSSHPSRRTPPRSSFRFPANPQSLFVSGIFFPRLFLRLSP